MSDINAGNGSERLILTIKGAYSVALIIIAAMALVAYLLLQQMLGSHLQGGRVLTLVENQKTLSQRVVHLANAAQIAPPERRAPLLASLRSATAEFEHNYVTLVDHLSVDAGADLRTEGGSVSAILFGPPYNLDYFSTSLVASGMRLYWAIEAALGRNEGMASAEMTLDAAPLDHELASATLAGYTALGQKLANDSDEVLEQMLSAHRYLFYATILVICLVALFIFRPMTEVIRRRTGELVEARNSMAFIAIHDGLTGLHNRAFVRESFDGMLKAAARRKERVAVLQVDLDRFKQINDTLGHAAGDYVLVKTAERMRQSCRSSDLVARLGGDEFLMLMPAAGSSDDIDGLARRILARLNEPIVFEGTTLTPGASAGIAVYPVDAENADDLLVHADLALYSAKRLGGGRFAFFSDELRQELDHRKQLERDLKQAIDDDSFMVYFQPQISLTDGSVTGVEALVRWKHPERGMVPPIEFIPVAERAGVMPQIGRAVMRKAIVEAAGWYRRGMRFGRLAINVSGTELREADFARFLFDTLEEAGLPPHKLSLEIVESVILDDEKTGIAAKLRIIRAAGVHLELDDFGTGYASLSHVNPNEIDRLKIDRRFVQNIDANDDNTKIVRAITELARGLGIAIIAEGAETEAELDSLLAIGCDHVQGYSIAFPMPDTEAGEWLAARSPKKPALTVVEGTGA